MDFPSNKAKPPDGEPKKIERVVTSEVTRRKKPLGRRFLETFVAGDPKQVLHYVVFDILIPAAKDMAADAFSQGIEKWLFGEARSASRRTGARPSGNSGYISYNRFSQSSSSPFSSRREDDRVRISRGAHNFDDLIVATRAEAETVIERLFDIIAKYEQVTVADLYEIVGVAGTPVDHNWGWTDLLGSGVTRISGGYLLDLPRPEALK